MQSLDGYLGHFTGDGVIAAAGQAIDAGAHDGVGAGFASGAEELVDIVLAVADVDESLRSAEQRRAVAHVGEPAHALRALDRYAGRVDPALQGGRALELRSGPESRRGKPERQSFGGECQAGMHQQHANRMEPEATIGLPPARHYRGGADAFGRVPLVGELGRVLKNEDGAIRRGDAVAGGFVASKCPRGISTSLTASLDKK